MDALVYQIRQKKKAPVVREYPYLERISGPRLDIIFWTNVDLKLSVETFKSAWKNLFGKIFNDTRSLWSVSFRDSFTLSYWIMNFSQNWDFESQMMSKGLPTFKIALKLYTYVLRIFEYLRVEIVLKKYTFLCFNEGVWVARFWHRENKS